MTKNNSRLLLILYISLAIMAFSGILSAEDIPDKVLHIFIPKEIPLQGLTIQYQLEGHGTYTEIIGKARDDNLSIELGYSELGKSNSAKILVYAPGYKMISREIPVTGTFLSEQWIPKFEKLSTVRLKGKLVDSLEKPLSGESLAVTYSLLEAMSYFRYLDGTAPTLKIANTITDEEGMFTIEVPSLLEDPFFINHQGLKEFTLSVMWPNVYSPIFPAWELVPSKIAVQKVYPEKLTIVLVNHAKLSGFIGPIFWKENEVVGDIAPHNGGTAIRPIK